MREFHKYGFIIMIGWNIMLIIITLIHSIIKEISPIYIFNDGVGGIGISTFLLIWSMIWYRIGYNSRKDYIYRKNMYRERNSKLDNEKLNHSFRLHYINEQTKILSFIILLAIPWYLLGHVKGSINKENLLIVTLFGILSLTCFYIYKKTKEKI